MAGAGSAGGGGGGGNRAAAAATAAAAVGDRGGWVADTEGPRSLAAVGAEGRKQRKEGKAPWRLPLEGAEGSEIARVLGKGVVPGSLTLVGGEPGVGKSTLLLQLAAMLTRTAGGQARQAQTQAQRGEKEATMQSEQSEGTTRQVLYVSGEESEQQLYDRALRLEAAAEPGALEALLVQSTTSIDEVLHTAVQLRPACVVVDSIQTVFLDGVSGSAGSVTQVRECAAALLRVAKAESIPIFLVGHVTKGGEIAGPRVLEHIVDAVLYLESDAAGGSCRMLRAFKNRFGPTDEVGLFEMVSGGMRALPDVSRLFMSDASAMVTSPSAVAAALQGSRGVMIEVQALAAELPENYEGPQRRVATGLDNNRLNMLLAIMAKSARMPAYGHEIYLNVTGGARLSDPGADLAVCVAVAASMRELSAAPRVAYAAEVGLGGELRPASQLARRLKEAARLGFERVVVAGGAAIGEARLAAREAGIEAVAVATLPEALSVAFQGAAAPRGDKRRSRSGYKRHLSDDDDGH